MPALSTKAAALHVYRTPQAGFGLRHLMVPLRTIPGVQLTPPAWQGNPNEETLGASDRNGPGKGAIRSEEDGRTLSWRAPESAKFGPGVDTYSDGDYLLEDGEDPGKFVQVRVTTAYLRPRPTEQPVYLQELWDGELEDFDASQAAAGAVADTNFTVENHSNTVITGVRVWIDPAATYLTISVDGGGSFIAPTTEAASVLVKPGGGEPDGLLRPLAANAAGVILRRTIPPATAANPKVTALLHFRFDGV
jgi:hypothetical protein